MTAAWLAWRDLAARRGRAALAAAVVAAGVALVVATEALSSAGAQAVASRIDEVAPPLRVVPAGVTASSLARLQPGPATLAPGSAGRARAALGDEARAVEEVLVVEERLGGAPVPVVGVEPRRLRLRAGEAAAGALLGARAGLGTASVVAVAGRSFRIAALLPAEAGAADLALFVPLADLREARGAPRAATELRIFPRAGASVRDAEARLRAALPEASVLRVDRGEVADASLPDSLARHRSLLYLLTAAVVAGCLLLAAHLDAVERRSELATLVAIGGTAGLVFRTLALRSALLGTAGGLAGASAGLAIAAAWGEGLPASSLVVAASGTLGATALAAVAVLPLALRCALRDPVRDLGGDC